MEVCCGLKGRFVTIQRKDTADVPLEVAEILMTATGEGCGDKVDEHQSSGNCVINAPVVGTYDDGLNDGSCPSGALCDNYLPTKVKVFSHDSSGGVFFADQNDALNKNSGDPSANLYSILDTLPSYQKSDGTWHFQLCWPNLASTTSDGCYCNEFTQTINPATTTPADVASTGYTAIKITWEKQCAAGNFNGIGKADSAAGNDGRTLMKLDPSNSVCWWGGIGAQTNHPATSTTTFPGPGIATDKVELYVVP